MNKDLRKVVIAGNWKMNNDRAATSGLIQELIPKVKDAGCDVIVCVPFTSLQTALDAVKGTNVKVAAQNCHFEQKGAYTGEVSVPMLKELGVQYVVIGHSERRQYFAETDETAGKKVKAALSEGLTVILCVGELLEEREQGITELVVSRQTKIALANVTPSEMRHVIIAYEPVWAIGTGRTATAEQAEEVCAYIRTVLAKLYKKETADAVTIQYGGSMNAANAKELLSKENVDGGLIGGASLKAEEFATIVSFA